MAITKFTINDESINYEVALEILGQEQQILLSAISKEKERETPSKEIIEYLESRFDAVHKLQVCLPYDSHLILQILDRNNHIYRI